MGDYDKMLIVYATILTVVLLCITVFLSVDFYFFLRNRYCRFHIGRWVDQDKWGEAIYKVALTWGYHTPTVKISDNSRYILLDMLQGKYSSHSIQSWQNAAIILGILERDREAAVKIAKQFINEQGEWKKAPMQVDHGMLAYAILKTCENPAKIRPAMDYLVNLIQKNTDTENWISYTGGVENRERYVDTLGLVCPFLALYARVYHMPQMATLSFVQLELYHRYGLLCDTCLPNHAIDAQTKLPLGVFGWGRGTCWYVLGLVDTYYELENGRDRNRVLDWIAEAAAHYVAFQRPDGGFGSTLQRSSSYDSSATAALAYFYVVCSQIFPDHEYFVVAQRCLCRLMVATRINGKIDWCQGDTKGIGVFAQTYDVMPFAQGLALRALGRMERGSPRLDQP